MRSFVYIVSDVFSASTAAHTAGTAAALTGDLTSSKLPSPQPTSQTSQSVPQTGQTAPQSDQAEDEPPSAPEDEVWDTSVDIFGSPVSHEARRLADDEHLKRAEEAISDEAVVKIFPQNVQPAPHMHKKIHLVHSQRREHIDHLDLSPTDHNVHRRSAVDNFEITVPEEFYTQTSVNDKSVKFSNIDIDVEGVDIDVPNIYPSELSDKVLINEARNNIDVFLQRQKRHVDGVASEPAQTDSPGSGVRLHYLTVDTTALAVDGEGYVVVNDTAVLAEHTLIEFYVSWPRLNCVHLIRAID